MLDKVLYVDENRVVMYFENRTFNVTTDNGTALKLADELLAPMTNHNFKTRTEYLVALANSEEDTVIINREDLMNNKDYFGKFLMLSLTTVVIFSIVMLAEAMFAFNSLNIAQIIGY